MGARPQPSPDRDAELATIRAKLARSVEDVKAGRTYPMEEVIAELLAEDTPKPAHGAADR